MTPKDARSILPDWIVDTVLDDLRRATKRRPTAPSAAPAAPAAVDAPTVTRTSVPLAPVLTVPPPPLTPGGA